MYSKFPELILEVLNTSWTQDKDLLLLTQEKLQNLITEKEKFFIDQTEEQVTSKLIKLFRVEKIKEFTSNYLRQQAAIEKEKLTIEAKKLIITYNTNILDAIYCINLLISFYPETHKAELNPLVKFVENFIDEYGCREKSLLMNLYNTLSTRYLYQLNYLKSYELLVKNYSIYNKYNGPDQQLIDQQYVISLNNFSINLKAFDPAFALKCLEILESMSNSSLSQKEILEEKNLCYIRLGRWNKATEIDCLYVLELLFYKDIHLHKPLLQKILAYLESTYSHTNLDSCTNVSLLTTILQSLHYNEDIDKAKKITSRIEKLILNNTNELSLFIQFNRIVKFLSIYEVQEKWKEGVAFLKACYKKYHEIQYSNDGGIFTFFKYLFHENDNEYDEATKYLKLLEESQKTLKEIHKSFQEAREIYINEKLLSVAKELRQVIDLEKENSIQSNKSQNESKEFDKIIEDPATKKPELIIENITDYEELTQPVFDPCAYNKFIQEQKKWLLNYALDKVSQSIYWKIGDHIYSSQDENIFKLNEKVYILIDSAEIQNLELEKGLLEKFENAIQKGFIPSASKNISGIKFLNNKVFYEVKVHSNERLIASKEYINESNIELVIFDQVLNHNQLKHVGVRPFQVIDTDPYNPTSSILEGIDWDQKFLEYLEQKDMNLIGELY